MEKGAREKKRKRLLFSPPPRSRVSRIVPRDLFLELPLAHAYRGRLVAFLKAKFSVERLRNAALQKFIPAIVPTRKRPSQFLQWLETTESLTSYAKHRLKLSSFPLIEQKHDPLTKETSPRSYITQE